MYRTLRNGRARVLVVASSAFLIIALFVIRSTSPTLSPRDMERVGFPDVKSAIGEEQGDNALARAAYEFRRLREPATDLIPKNIRARELAHARMIPQREAFASKNSVAANWSARGPNNVGGRTRALAIDLDFNGMGNRRLLAGGISGGMYRSENDGESWQLTTSLGDFASVTAIAQDPLNRNIWYYGTGEVLGNSASGVGAPHHGQGIFKSTDSGATWTQLQSTLSTINSFDSVFDRIWSLAVHPSNGAVFAAVHGMILRSDDGGNTWGRVLGPEGPPFGLITDVTIASNGNVYATISNNGAGVTDFGIFRSTDGGASWANISPPTLTSDPWRQVIATAPSDPNTAYLLVQNVQAGATAGDHSLYRYNAASNGWTDLSSNLPDVTQPDGNGNAALEGNASFSSQGGYDLVIAVKPDDPNTFWIGGTNLYRSTNGGQNFTLVGGYASPYTYGAYDSHHSDQHAISFYPNDPNAMLSGHDGGVTKSVNVLATPTVWEDLNNGYLTSQFYAVAIDPTPGSDLIIGGLQDNGTWSTESTNSQASWFREFSGDGGYAAIAPGGLPYYVSSQLGNVIRASVSDNQLVGSAIAPAGGQNFQFITPYLLDPNDPRVMYMAAGDLVWRNSNLDAIPPGNGQPTQVNWTALTGASIQGAVVSAIAVSKSPANRLYIGVTDFQFTTHLIRVDAPASNGDGVLITPDGITQGSYPSSIGVNPDNADELIATFSNYGVPSIWYSNNGGASWSSIEGNLGGDDGPSVSWALIMPTASGTIYFVATSTGVYSTESINGTGTTWLQEGGGVIGNVDVDMLVGRPEDGLIVAGTHGRGVYSANLQGTAGSGVLAADVNELMIAAQPGDIATGTFELQNTGSIKLGYSITFDSPGKTLAKPGLTRHKLKNADQPLVRKRTVASKTGASNLQIKARPLGAPSTDSDALPRLLAAGEDRITYDDGNQTSDDFWGFGDEELGLFWGNDFLADGFDFQLERFEFFMRTESELDNEVWVAIYDDLGESLISGTVSLETSTNGAWFEIFWNDPIPIADGETFFIEIGASDNIQFPAGIDSDAAVPGRSYFASLGEDYVNLQETNSGFENGAFLIRPIGTLGGGQNQPPEVDAVASTFDAVVGEIITFDATASTDPDGQIVSYLWDFGDGNTSSDAVTTHAYSAPGIYSVSITVTDDDGDTDTAGADITITSAANQAPVAVIQTSSTSAGVGESIAFDASQSSDSDGQIASYLWNFGDGVESAQAVTQHAYTEAGVYNVSLQLTDNGGATGQTSTQIQIIDQTVRLSATPLKGTLTPSGSALISVQYDTNGLEEGTYEAQLIISSVTGVLTLPVTILVNRSVSNEDDPSTPSRFILAQNYPNPFNPETVIQFELPVSTQISLAVFDLSGRQVRLLADGIRAAGAHQVRWDARDDAGNEVASGVYFYRLVADADQAQRSNVLTGKMTLVR